MNPLASRKQLLVVESELNRVQVADDLAALKADVHRLTERAKSVGSIVSSAAVLVAGLTAFRHSQPADAETKPSWTKRILKGAGLISTLWMAFRPRSDDSEAR